MGDSGTSGTFVYVSVYEDESYCVSKFEKGNEKREWKERVFLARERKIVVKLEVGEREEEVILLGGETERSELFTTMDKFSVEKNLFIFPFWPSIVFIGN